MDEHDWLTSTDAATMLAFVAGRDAPAGAILPVELMTERKLRLFLVCCCRQGWGLFPSPVARRAVETAEAYADGLADDVALDRARKAALRSQRRRTPEMPAWRPEARRRKSAELWIVSAAAIACAPFAELIRRRVYRGRSASFVPKLARHRQLDGGLATTRIADAIAWADETDDQGHGRAAPAGHAELLRCIVGDPFRPRPQGNWPGATVQRLARSAYDERAFDALPILADAVPLGHLRGPGPHARGCWALDAALGRFLAG